MPTPKVDAILKALDLKDYGKEFPAQRRIRVEESLQILADAKAAGKIYNVEFKDAKYWVAAACEHAQHATANVAREKNEDGSRKFLATGDPRNDIGYAFGMNQAAKLARRLKKLPWDATTPEIAQYIVVLEEIAALNLWLKEFKTIIVKGRRPNQNKTQEQIAAELVNTGICAICANRQKLETSGNEGMVMHGYQMSEYNHAGYRMGKCFGVGYKPYELSNEANVSYAPVLENHRKAIKNALKNLRSGLITSVDVERQKRENGKTVSYTVTYTKEANPYEFQQEIESRIHRCEFELDAVNDDIKINQAKIDNWTLQPLKYGTKVVA